MRGKYRPFAEDSKGILKNLGGKGENCGCLKCNLRDFWSDD
jgi:hypothetical protein